MSSRGGGSSFLLLLPKPDFTQGARHPAVWGRALRTKYRELVCVILGFLVLLDFSHTIDPCEGLDQWPVPRERSKRVRQDSWKAWAAACPSGTFRSDVDGGAQAHAVAAAKARNPIGCFLALAYGKIASNIVDAVEKFEGRLATDMADRRKKAALGRRAIVQGFHDVMNGGDGQQDMTIDGLSRLAALAPREDVLGRRVLFHVDFSRAKERSPRDLTSDAAGGSGSGKNFRVEHRLYSSETVQLVAEQVRAMLAAKAATVAIISESAAPSAGTIVTRGHNSPSAPLSLRARVASVSLKRGIETSGSSLRAIATTVSSLLGMEVEFYETVPEMGEALAECGSAGDAGIGGSSIPFIPRLMMVERLSAPGVVPAPAVKDPEMSDAEEERLPDFAWGGEGERVWQLMQYLFVLNM